MSSTREKKVNRPKRSLGHPSGTTSTRRGGGRSSSSARRGSRITSDGNPIPVSQMIEFPYVQNVQMDPTSGAPVVQLWNLTGMYDPDQTGTGHQPMGFDQWVGLFYNYYTVVEAFWDVIIMSQNAAGTGQALIVHGLSDDSSVSSDPTTLWENPTFSVTPLGSMGSSHDVVRFHGHLDIARHFGITREALIAAADHAGSSSAIPVQNVFLQVVCAANNSTVNPDNVVTWTKLRFKAVLTERRELPQS